MSSRTTLSTAADDRKARLAKLRSIKRKQPDGEIVPPESDRASPAVAPRSPGAEGGRQRPTDEEEEVAEATEEQPHAEPQTPDVARLHLSGRNYDPEVRGAKLGFEIQPNLAAGDNTLEAKAAQLEAAVRRQQHEEGGGDGDENTNGGAAPAIDLFKLQPKKPNWDLKRELNKRLEPINARTDRAIAQLVRERLAGKQQEKQQAKEAKHGTAAQSTPAGDEDGDEGVGLEGVALVEGIRQREQEDEEEERRERELEEDEDMS